MDRAEKHNYWLDAAEYDMVSAEVIMKAGRCSYVAFMCQQSLEKLSNGLYNY